MRKQRYNMALINGLIEYFYATGLWKIGEDTSTRIYTIDRVFRPNHKDIHDHCDQTDTGRYFYNQPNKFISQFVSPDKTIPGSIFFFMPKLYAQQIPNFMRPIKEMAEYCRHTVANAKTYNHIVVLAPSEPFPYPASCMNISLPVSK